MDRFSRFATFQKFFIQKFLSNLSFNKRSEKIGIKVTLVQVKIGVIRCQIAIDFFFSKKFLTFSLRKLIKGINQMLKLSKKQPKVAVIFRNLPCDESQGLPRQMRKSVFILPLNRIFLRIIIKHHNFQMILSTFHLFSPVFPGVSRLKQELENPYFRNIFTHKSTEMLLILTENYIVITENTTQIIPTYYLELSFQVKFEILYQAIDNQSSLGTPFALKLERQCCTQQLTFQANQTSIIEMWGLQLQKKINQRNFHKLFKAKRKIGKGAFATVYLAERLRDHKMVAVKAFSKEKQYSGQKGRESLENEVKLMRKISHQNIMKLQGVYQTDNSIYVILEYLEGQQLNQMLKSNKKIESHQTKQIMKNILRALSHLSKLRIIHRDLKPENIMFRKENSFDLAICDFGLATNADEDKYLFVRCGTPGFVAPQIINIRDMNSKSQPVSDVFSAGIIFHYLLFGFSAFQGKKYNEILTQNRACALNFNKDIYSKIEAKTLDLLKRMLQKEAINRISVDQALNHPYFSGQMQIEVEQKNPIKQLSINLLSFKSKDLFEITSPTAILRKKDQKMLFMDSARKENTKILYQ